MPEDPDHLRHIAADSARFQALLARTDPAAAVPTCPGWHAADLLWHLTEVQSFWSRLVRQRCSHPAELTGEDLTRPHDHGELVGLAGRVTAELVEALRSTPPSTPVWTWADDHTAGFIRRRQAHEALIHRVDAECVVGERGPVDAALAADGVDEALRVMFDGATGRSERTVDGQATLRLRSTDTGDTWLATLARSGGAAPHGEEGPGPSLSVAREDHGLPTAATVGASAADLDCWLWNRPALGVVELAGDVHVLAGLRAVVADGIQ